MYQIPFIQGESPQARGDLWEKNVSRGLLQYLRLKEEGGDVIPLQKQIIRGRISRPQKIDILVDNAGGWNFGVECKSSSKPSLTLGAWFNHRGGKDSQFSRETKFLRNTNRIGFAALVMMEAGSGENFPRYGAYFIPWNLVERIRTRKITTTILDKFVKSRVVYKIPTIDGTVWLPITSDVFRELTKMNRRAEKLPDEDFSTKYFVRKPRTTRKKNPVTLPAGRSKKKCLAPVKQELTCELPQQPT